MAVINTKHRQHGGDCGTGFRAVRFRRDGERSSRWVFFHTGPNYCDVSTSNQVARFGPDLAALAEHCPDWRPLLDWLLDNAHTPAQQAVAAAVERLLAAEVAPC